MEQSPKLNDWPQPMRSKELDSDLERPAASSADLLDSSAFNSPVSNSSALGSSKSDRGTNCGRSRLLIFSLVATATPLDMTAIEPRRTTAKIAAMANRCHEMNLP